MAKKSINQLKINYIAQDDSHCATVATVKNQVFQTSKIIFIFIYINIKVRFGFFLIEKTTVATVAL